MLESIIGAGVVVALIGILAQRGFKRLDDVNGKTNSLHEKLEKAYLTKDKHADLCQIASYGLKAFVSHELKRSEERIIDAVKANGKTET